MCNKKSNMHGLSWQNIEAMDDVQKAGVAEVLEINVLIEHMSSYIINSRSDNTAKSYYYSFIMARNAKLEN
jgi:hypothetical protein